MLRKVLRVGVLAVFLTILGGTRASMAQSPGDLVDGYHEELLEAMRQGENWDYDRRFRELEGAVEGAYHFEIIARVILGGFWAEADETERAEFAEALKDLAVANLAAEFDRYAGESFEHVAEQELSREQVLVRTTLRRSGEESIRFDYVLARHEGEWGILNVVVDGVSDLSLKRAEYQSVLQQRGFAALLSEVRSQVDAFGGVPGGS